MKFGLFHLYPRALADSYNESASARDLWENANTDDSDFFCYIHELIDLQRIMALFTCYYNNAIRISEVCNICFIFFLNTI